METLVFFFFLTEKERARKILFTSLNKQLQLSCYSSEKYPWDLFDVNSSKSASKTFVHKSVLSNLLWPLCVFRELRDLNWVNDRPNSSLFHPQAADLTGGGARSPQIAVCLMVERYYSGIRDQRGTTPWDFFLPSTLVSPPLPDLLASLLSSSSYCCSSFSQPSPFFFSFLSSFPYPFPFSPPYILRILTESTARTRRHTRAFLERLDLNLPREEFENVALAWGS